VHIASSANLPFLAQCESAPMSFLHLMHHSRALTIAQTIKVLDLICRQADHLQDTL